MGNSPRQGAPHEALAPVAIPNSSASSDKQEMQNLKKRIADLEKARGSQSKQSAQLALPGPSAPAQGAKGCKGSNNKKKVKGKGKSSSSFQPASSSNQTKNFQYLMKLPTEFRSQFHERFHKREICFLFPKGSVQELTELVQVCSYFVLVAVDPSHTMSACVSQTEPHEPHPPYLLKRLQEKPFHQLARCPTLV